MCLPEQLKKLESPQSSRTMVFRQTVTHLRRSDIIVLDKGIKNCHIIDIAIQNGTNIAIKVIEKITNYSDLKVEIPRLFGMQKGNVKVIPMVIGALESIS